MSPPDLSRESLAAMSACAYRLGMAFAGEAERAADWSRRIEFFQLFDRCFFSVRVATALQLRLARPPGEAGRREGPGEREDLRERESLSAADRPPRERADADREREAEPASVPILLKTLEGVVHGAAALPGPAPAELPALRELLDRLAKPARAATRAPAARQPGGLRRGLAGPAAAALVGLPSAGPPSPRSATGPPPP